MMMSTCSSERALVLGLLAPSCRDFRHARVAEEIYAKSTEIDNLVVVAGCMICRPLNETSLFRNTW